MWGLVIKHLCKSPGQRCSPAWPVSWSNLAEDQRAAGIRFSFGTSSEPFGLGDLGIRPICMLNTSAQWVIAASHLLDQEKMVQSIRILHNLP